MKFIGRLTDVSIDFMSGLPKITFLMNNKTSLESIEDIKDIEKLSVEAKKWRQNRSLDANAYLWVLIYKLAEKLNLAKTEVYKKAISEVGVCEVLPIRNCAVDRFIEEWSKRGLGWMCETTKSKIDGYTNVHAYYGSSAYDTKEMSRLVDNIVQECKIQGIETMTDSELLSLKEAWKNEKASQNKSD